MQQTVDYVMEYLYKRLPLPIPRKSPFSKNTHVKVDFKRLIPTYYGYQRGLEIVLRTGTWTQKEVIDTLSHEYRHIWQELTYPRAYTWYKNRIRKSYWYHPMEIDARAFAETVLSELETDPHFPWWE